MITVIADGVLASSGDEGEPNNREVAIYMSKAEAAVLLGVIREHRSNSLRAWRMEHILLCDKMDNALIPISDWLLTDA